MYDKEAQSRPHHVAGSEHHVDLDGSGALVGLDEALCRAIEGEEHILFPGEGDSETRRELAIRRLGEELRVVKERTWAALRKEMRIRELLRQRCERSMERERRLADELAETRRALADSERRRTEAEGSTARAMGLSDQLLGRLQLTGLSATDLDEMLSEARRR